MLEIKYDNPELEYEIKYKFNLEFFDSEWLEEKMALLGDITKAFISEYKTQLEEELENIFEEELENI